MLRIKGIIISGVDKRYGIMMPPGLFGKRGYGLSKRKDQTGMLLPVKSDHFPNILEDPYVKGREKWRNQGR